MSGRRSSSLAWSGVKPYMSPSIKYGWVPSSTTGLSLTPLDQRVTPAPASTCQRSARR